MQQGLQTGKEYLTVPFLNFGRVPRSLMEKATGPAQEEEND